MIVQEVYIGRIPEIDEMFNTLVNVLDDYFVIDFTSLMSKYNRKG